MGAWATCTPLHPRSPAARAPGGESAEISTSEAIRPTRQIVAVCGDGGLGQYLAELTTLAKYRMDITVVVLANGQLGKITKEQRAAMWDVWQTSLHNPSFAAVAGASGLHAQRVEYAGELDAGSAPRSTRRGLRSWS